MDYIELINPQHKGINLSYKDAINIADGVDTDLIRMNRNENPFGMSAQVKIALQNNISMLHRYPANHMFELKEKIALHYHIEPSQIVLSNGSDKLIILLANLFLNESSEIIIPEYSFIAYQMASRLMNARVKIVPLKNWQMDLLGIQNNINTKTKLIFIANPNNPSGACIFHKELDEFLNKIPKHIIVVIDEAYGEFAKYKLKAKYPNVLDLQKKYDNIILLKTFSKAYGLAGLRIGFSIANKEISSMLSKLDFPYCLTQIATLAASVALDDEKHVEMTVKNNFIEMEKLRDYFEKNKLSYILTPANYVLLNLGDKAIPIFNKLAQQGVLVYPLTNYKLPNFLRITVGTPGDNLRFMEALSNSL